DRPALRTSMRSWVGAPPSIRPAEARSVTSTPSNDADASIGPVVGCAATLALGTALGPALCTDGVGDPGAEADGAPIPQAARARTIGARRRPRMAERRPDGERGSDGTW